MLPLLTNAQFNALDRNDDGFLSPSELAAQVVQPSGCCQTGKSYRGPAGYVGDLFLLGLALVTLLGWNAGRHER